MYPSSYTSFILNIAGESNAQGAALNTELDSAALSIRPSLKLLNQNTCDTFQSLKIGNPGSTNWGGDATNKTLHGMEDQVGRFCDSGILPNPLYLVKTGLGGSKIADWDPGREYWATYTKRMDNGMDILTQQNSGHPPGIMMWWSQGINDGRQFIQTPFAWKRKTKALFVRMRERYGQQFPIFITKLPRGYFDRQIEEICDEMPECFYVSCKDAGVQKDGIHWNSAGLNEITKRLTELMLSKYTMR